MKNENNLAIDLRTTVTIIPISKTKFFCLKLVKRFTIQ